MADLLPSEIATGIAGALALIVFRLFSTALVDSIREKLFALRDEMMIYAYQQELIDNRAYKNLRHLINGFIRYAHRLSFTKLMLIRYARGRNSSPPTEEVEWRAAVAALPEGQRQKFEEFNQRAILTVVEYMILCSPVVWIIAPFLLAHVGVVKPTLNRVAAALEPKMPIREAEFAALRTFRDAVA